MLVPRAHVAQLRFALPRPTPGTVGVFNAHGAVIRTILSGDLAAGEHACAWDGRDDLDAPAPPGTYAVRLIVGERVLTSRSVTIG
jgi:flagellar hook assembly protein FlgD